MQDHPTTLWRMRHDDEQVVCQVRLVPYGIEIDIVVHGRVMLTRAFATETEALEWAESKRAAREARGWTPLPEEDRGPTPVI